MFNPFKAREKTTVKQVLDHDKVIEAVNTWRENAMCEARAVIIIWATQAGDVHVTIGGGIQNECTARGMLLYADDIIAKEGIPND